MQSLQVYLNLKIPDNFAEYNEYFLQLESLILSAKQVVLKDIQKNDQSAWIKTMAIWASIAFILLLICFLKCEEKVVIEAQAKQEKIPLKQSLKALVTNQYFWAVVILWTMQNGIYCVTGTILPYYCKYIFHNDTWMYSALYLTETLIIVVAIFLSPMLLKKYGKRNMSLAGACLALVGQLIFCLNPTNWGFMVFSCIIRGLGFEKCLPKH